MRQPSAPHMSSHPRKNSLSSLMTRVEQPAYPSRRTSTSGSILPSDQTPTSNSSTFLPSLNRKDSTAATTTTEKGALATKKRTPPNSRTNSVVISTAKMESTFGLVAEAKVLEKWKQTKLNSSPFDANMFLPMLKPCPRRSEGKITLCLDIDETLVHSSLKKRPGLRYDTTIHIGEPGAEGDIFVAHRPHLQTFLRAIKPLFEVVVFTASQSCYADQLMDIIDPDAVVTDRLYREHCTEVNGARVKDLSLLGRPMDRIVILDNSPVAYLFQPRNAIPIESWFEDENDTELLKLLPFLRQLATQDSVHPILDMYNASLLSAGSQ